MPAIFAAVHATRHVPTTAIVATTLLTLALALSGSFEALAVIGVMARFLQYIPTCLAVLVFRHRDQRSGAAPGFRIALGPVVPILATLLCLGLLTQASADKLLWGGAFVVAGVPFYFLLGRPRRATSDDRST
jgi:amino acid transporter